MHDKFDSCFTYQEKFSFKHEVTRKLPLLHLWKNLFFHRHLRFFKSLFCQNLIVFWCYWHSFCRNFFWSFKP